jgi:TPR repeat protein
LALLYKNGLVKDKKEEKMLYCYEQAIEKGNINAMNNLGLYYYEIKVLFNGYRKRKY